MKNSVESILTRGISILSKFILVGFLAKKLSLNDYGSFQLVSYFILISTTVLGLEYYNLTNRKIPKVKNAKKVYQNHLSFFLTIGPFALIAQILLFLVLFPKELITLPNIIFIVCIGLCDYIAQEVYRYLMINKSFRRGNKQLIYKSSFLLILLLIFSILYKELYFSQVLVLMVISYILLVILALYSFSKTLIKFDKKDFKLLSREQFKKNVKAVLPFLILVFFLKGIEFLDKFVIGKTLGLEETGIYSFIFTVASTIHIFIVSGFYIIHLPQLISAYSESKTVFKKELIRFTLLIVASSIVLVIMIPFLSPFVFDVIGKSEFSAETQLLYLLLFGFIVNNLSLIPHLYLYVVEDEIAITVIMGLAFLVNIILIYWLVPVHGIYGAAFSFVSTYFIILILKLLRANYKWRKTTV